MKTREERKQIATNDGITPNFKSISKYYNDTNEERFYYFYEYFKEKDNYKEAKILIKKNKLNEYESDLIYFLVESGQSLDFNNWAGDVNLANAHQKALLQTIKLLDLFSKTKSTPNPSAKSEPSKPEPITEIKFYTNKGCQLTINTSLCFDICYLLEEHYIKKSEDLIILSQNKVNINPRQYKKQFVLGLKPLIGYLKNETPNNFQSANKTYSFIADLINTLNDEICLSGSQIKEFLKAK